MRRRVAVYGASEEAIALLPRLAGQPGLELGAVFDPDARVLRRRLALIEPRAAALLQRHLTDEAGALEGDPALAWVVEGGQLPPFSQRFPELARRLRLSSAAEVARRLGLAAASAEATSTAAAPAGDDPEGWALARAGLAILALDDADAVAGETAHRALAMAGGGAAIVRLRGDGDRFRVRGRAVREPAGGAELGALEREAARAALRTRRPQTEAPEASGTALWAGVIAARGRLLGTLAVLGSGTAPLSTGIGRRLEPLAAFAGHALAALSPPPEAARPASVPAPNRPAFAAALERALAGADDRAVVVLSCRVEAPTPGPEAAARQRRARRDAARALERRLGPDDLLDPGEEGPLLALLRDAPAAATERVTTLVRAVAEDVVSREKQDDASRTGLHFGYAVYPADGDSSDALLARARLPRIRML